MDKLISEIGYVGIREGKFLDFSSESIIEELSIDDDNFYRDAIAQDSSEESFSSRGIAKSYGDVLSFGDSSSRKNPSKTKDLFLLENFLAEAYHYPDLKITRVEALPKTKKEVKRVYFVMNDDLYQVWVFKADSDKTAKELNICDIVHRNGIPTARPIGDFPKPDEKYPYEIAVLGGIVEHAGESYDRLLENLILSPDQMYKTAKNVGKLLAGFHVKLTSARKQFEERGIILEKSSPREYLTERMLPCFKTKEKEFDRLIDLCEQLYNKQQGDLVVSHNDTHTGNIVTVQTSPNGGQLRTSLTDFGIIDHGSIGLDYPQSDLLDFWIHHYRKASNVCKNYPFDFSGVEESYENECAILERQLGTNLQRGGSKNVLIQQTLWNIYEMYDPTRKIYESKLKSAYHYNAFLKLKDSLQRNGFGEDYSNIKAELDKIRKLFNTS